MTNDGCDPLLAVCLGRVLLNTNEENGIVCEGGWESDQAREGVGKRLCSFATTQRLSKEGPKRRSMKGCSYRSARFHRRRGFDVMGSGQGGQ